MNSNFLRCGKVILSLLLIAKLAANVQAQESFPGEYNSIKVSGAVTVLLNKSEICSLKVEALAEDTSKIISHVENGILSITTKGKIKDSDKLRVSIGIRELKNLELSGASDVKTSAALVADKLYIQSSGAGDAHLEINANKIETEVSGAGNLHLPLPVLLPVAAGSWPPAYRPIPE